MYRPSTAAIGSIGATIPARVRAGMHSLPLPRSYAALKPRDIWAVVIAVGLIIEMMWVRHGGLSRDLLTASGEVTALVGTYAALVGILFAARAPWLDQVLGTDGLRSAHRILGFVAVWAIGAHAVLSTIAYAGGSIAGAIPTLISLVLTVPGMLGAVVGLALFGVVAVSSVRAARRRLSYESWHGIHLYVYLAVAFAFLHQLTIGADFLGDSVATWFWIGLYVVAFGPLLLHRVAWPMWLTLRHRPRIKRIVAEAGGSYSLYVGGRAMERLAVRPGQFFVVRALTRRDWMHGHPFSISAAPDGRTLRFTFKTFGQGTRDLAALRPGTPLLLEGPYGAMHEAKRQTVGVLLICGGIGVSPIRAMAQSFAIVPGAADMIYRAQSEPEAPLLDELRAIAARRDMRLHLVFGRRGSAAVGDDPLGPDEIARLIPDAARRDVYVCGPTSLMDRVRDSMHALGTPPKQIHFELFG